MTAQGVGVGSHKIPARHNPFKSPMVVQDYGFTIGAEGTNTITVNVQARDANRKDVEQAVSGRFYFSSDSVGLDVVTTPPSTLTTAGTDGAITPIESGGSSAQGKQFFFTTEADGDLDLVIVEAGALTVYLVFVNPDGSLSVSSAVTFAS